LRFFAVNTMKLNFAIFPLLVLFLLGNAPKSSAQKGGLIQFSGLVVTGDSLQAIPFSSVSIKSTNQGTITDYYGYFSFVAETGDTILFSSVGYKSSEFIIPNSLNESKYAMVHILRKDTIYLPETVVYPWPTREQFKEAFLHTDIPDDDITLAQKNLNPETLAEIQEYTPMSASGNFKFQMGQYQQKLYYAGQTPPIQIFNPFAWAEFIKAWKNGDFKRDK
jgi:hypothetical protein